jgi:hypothetical protein
MPHSAKRHKSDAYYLPGREGFLLSFWIYDALRVQAAARDILEADRRSHA